MSDYDQDDWYDDEMYAREREEEFAARPFRLFYRFATRNFDDIAASYALGTVLDFARDWQKQGVLLYWRIVRIADGVTLVSWQSPTPMEADHDNG